jgi:F-type H+-transporting ATPase subunit delta
MAKGKQTSAAGQYAAALLDLASEQNSAPAIGEELRQLRELIETNPRFGAFLTDPAIKGEERRKVLQSTLKGRINLLLYNTLGVMNQKGRLGLLGRVADEYARRLDERQGNLKAEVTVAKRLADDQLEQVRQRIGKAFGKNAIVQQREDPRLIGGLVIRVGDRLIDASVKTQLEAMRKRLLSAAR